MMRLFNPSDLEDYLGMSRDFYASDATDHPVPDEHFKRTFSELLKESPIARGWIILDDHKNSVGYFLASVTWSNEYGGKIAWLEELYLKPEVRRQGLGRRVLEAAMAELKSQEQVNGFRLEVTKANESVAQLYRQLGFQVVPYSQWGMSI